MWIQKVPGGGVAGLSYAPDGRTLYSLDAGGWATAWDVASHVGRRLAKLDHQTFGIAHAFAALADGRRVVVLANFVAVCDATSPNDPERVSPPEMVLWSNGRVRPDGRVYSLDIVGRRIVGWDLTTGTLEPGRGVPRGVAFIRQFDLAPDGRWVAVAFRPRASSWKADETAAIFEWGKGPDLRNPVPVTGVGAPYAFRFSPDGRTLAVATDPHKPQLALWDVADRRPRVAHVPCALADDTFAFNPVFPLFAALGPDSALALWRLETGEQVRALDFMLGRYVRCVTFSPDGLTCAVGGSNKQFAVFDVDV
jgi:WD40 repeat protein